MQRGTKYVGTPEWERRVEELRNQKLDSYFEQSREKRLEHIDSSATCEFARNYNGSICSKTTQSGTARKNLEKFLEVKKPIGTMWHTCHVCENDSSSNDICVQPKHLYFGTNQENWNDRKKLPSFAKLRQENVELRSRVTKLEEESIMQREDIEKLKQENAANAERIRRIRALLLERKSTIKQLAEDHPGLDDLIFQLVDIIRSGSTNE